MNAVGSVLKMQMSRVHLSNGELNQADSKGDGLDIYLKSKADLENTETESAISGLTGLGVDRLLKEITVYLQDRVAGAGVATRTRHQLALEKAATALQTVTTGLAQGDLPVDLLAEDLRTAIRALDNLIGRVDVENVLGEIFSSFCNWQIRIVSRETYI